MVLVFMFALTFVHATPIGTDLVAPKPTANSYKPTVFFADEIQQRKDADFKRSCDVAKYNLKNYDSGTYEVYMIQYSSGWKSCGIKRITFASTPSRTNIKTRQQQNLDLRRCIFTSSNPADCFKRG